MYCEVWCCCAIRVILVALSFSYSAFWALALPLPFISIKTVRCGFRERKPDVKFVGIMQYDGDLKLPANYLVPPPVISQVSGEHLVASGIRTFACSETQKFGHVTFFWNGNRSGYFDSKLETFIEVLAFLSTSFHLCLSVCRSMVLSPHLLLQLLCLSAHCLIEQNMHRGSFRPAFLDVGHATSFAHCTKSCSAFQVVICCSRYFGASYAA
jgi:hypothetical protein